MEDWALIRHLYHSEKLSKRAIAAKLGIARDTVTNALSSDGPPKYQRPSVDSAISAVEPKIRALLSEHPTMPATVIAERIGWGGSISWLRERVRAIRPEYAPADPADRLDHDPGQVVQCDLWFPPASSPLGGDQSGAPPVLVMVAAFSRFITAMMLPSRVTTDLVAGMWRCLAGSRCDPAPSLVGQRVRYRSSRPVDGSGDGIRRNGCHDTDPAQTVRPKSPKESSSASTDFWKPRSCRVEHFVHPTTSTRNWLIGSRSRILGLSAGSAVAQ